MKKLLLISLLVLFSLFAFNTNAAISFTASPTSLTVSGQEDLTLTRNIVFTNTGANGTTDNLTIGSTFAHTQTDFQDKQGDLITFTRSPNPLNVNIGAQGTLSLTINIANKVKVGTYTGNLNFSVVDTDAGTPDQTFTLPVTVRVDPKICEDGRVSDGNQITNPNSGNLILDIKDPDDGDNFNPGSEIRVRVNVENNNDDDMDVVVEAILYNIDQNSEIVSVESDSVDIEEDKDEDFDFILKVPSSDSDLDEGDDFILFIKASEDGNEDENCDYDSISLDFDRNTNDVAVNSVTISPSVAMCADTVNIAVDVQNVGTKDQDSVQVRVKETTLGMDLSSEIFSLKKFDKSGDSALKTFTFKLPEDAKAGDYFVDTRVFFTSRSSSSTLTKLTLQECKVSVTTSLVELTLPQTSFTANPGKVFTVPLTLKNPGTQTVTYSVDVKADNWADVSAEQRISVSGGEQTTVYAYLTPRPSLAAGTYTATVEVRQNDNLLKTASVTANVAQSTTTPTGGVTFQPSVTFASIWQNLAQSTAFWIAAVVIVFALVIYVLSALLRPR